MGKKRGEIQDIVSEISKNAAMTSKELFCMCRQTNSLTCAMDVFEIRL